MLFVALYCVAAFAALVAGGYLLWRVETLQELPSEEDMDDGSLRSKSQKI